MGRDWKAYYHNREPAHVKARRMNYAREYQRELRRAALRSYGGACACCGETQPEFLAIDHIAGGGTRHRREIGGGGGRLYQWLQRHGYPPGFRVLCHNCNAARGSYGQCPHVLKSVAQHSA